MQNSTIAIQIKKDDLLGTIFHPYIIVKEHENYYKKNRRITQADLENQNFSFSDWEITIIKISLSLSYAELNKRFNKKHLNITFSEYLKSANEKSSYFIHSYIEKKNNKFIQIIKNNEPILFIVKDRDLHIYNENIIQISHEPAAVEMEFEKKLETLHYRLQVFHNKQPIDLTHHSISVLSNKHPTVIYKNNMFWFENNKFNGNKLKPFLNKPEVIIPSKLESVFFEKFIKPSVRNFNCMIKGFEFHKINIKPKTEIRIEKTIFGDFIFNLFFIYKSYKIQFSSKQKSFIDVIETNGKYALEVILRDYKAEEIIVNNIIYLGLKEKETIFIVNQKAKNKYDFFEHIRKLVRKLQQKGYKIINNLFIKEVSYNIPKLSYTTNQKQDWFDLYIRVQFGEFEIEFIQLKNHILNHIKEFELPDGTIAIIPDTWFSELYPFAKRTNKNNQTSILKTHVRLLENNAIVVPDKTIEKSIREFVVKKEVSLPKNSIAKLRDYQKIGYQWLFHLTQNQFGVCLADDMGLGKTLQVITLLQQYFETHTSSIIQPVSNTNKTQNTSLKIQLSLFDEAFVANEDIKDEKGNNLYYKSALLVVPKSLIYNWIIELQKFAPELSYSVYHSIDRQENIKDTFHKKNIIITTYGVIRKDIDILKNEQFSYLILDESQAIKNPNSKTYQAVVLLDSQYRISMTGTPMENHLIDLWSQMNFLNHNILGDLNYFEKAFRSQIQNNTEALELEELRNIINPFILRRLKKDVAKELPEKIEQTVFCEMHLEQKEWYEKEKSAARNELLSEKSKKNYIDVLAVLNRLRQISIHPRLLDHKSGMTSGKFETIVQYINNIIEQGDKFLIFSSFVKHLELFKQYFENHNINYSMLTGKDHNRQQIVEEFESNNAIKPFLISIKAGGVGLNLTSANYVFIIDPWWNPFVELQAIDRTHRIGQDKNVMVYRFISKNTIEEKIIHLQQIKLHMSDHLIEKEFTEKMNLEDLLKLI